LTTGPLYGSIPCGRARWGASGALYPQPAVAGSNSLSRPDFLGLPSLSSVEDWVRRGRNVPNPARSGRKQRSALLSWVLSGCLVGAGWRRQAGRSWSKEGARPLTRSRLTCSQRWLVEGGCLCPLWTQWRKREPLARRTACCAGAP